MVRGEIVWTPNDRQASKTRLFEFANGAGFDELHKWSVDSPDEFWRKIWQFCDVVGERVVDRRAERGVRLDARLGRLGPGADSAICLGVTGTLSLLPVVSPAPVTAHVINTSQFTAISL